MAGTITYTTHHVSVPRPALVAGERRVALGLAAAVLVFLALATWDIRLPASTTTS